MSDTFIENSLSLLSLKNSQKKIEVLTKFPILNGKNSIIWDSFESVGIVEFPKGKIWNSIGVVKSEQARIFADEALYLVENYEFKLFVLSESFEFPLKLEKISELLSLINKDSGFTSYKLFKILKNHGYILMRPECKYYPKNRIFKTLRAEYSLFKPSSGFKKSNPSGLIGYLMEVKSEDNINTITLLMESISGPAILAISDGLDGFCFLEASIIQPLPYIRAFGNRSK